MPVTHLLDTSAILAHYLDEPGAEQVSALLAAGPSGVAMAAPSWPELARRLAELIADDPIEVARVHRRYTRDLCAFIPVDEPAALAAMRIQQACSTRIPLIDTLIAGCAAHAGLTLVHRDPHLDAIPARQIRTLRLSDKFRQNA